MGLKVDMLKRGFSGQVSTFHARMRFSCRLRLLYHFTYVRYSVQLVSDFSGLQYRY